jgi:hypothetical protein
MGHSWEAHFYSFEEVFERVFFEMFWSNLRGGDMNDGMISVTRLCTWGFSLKYFISIA